MKQMENGEKRRTENDMKRIPFRLIPAEKENLWGGSHLKTEYGKQTEIRHLAETWECSTHPDGLSTAQGGVHDGESLPQILREHPEYIGTRAVRRMGERPGLPILVKLIDAMENLSVQVHPDDAYALEHEHSFGKTEMWYILRAEPGAKIVYGFQRDVTREELRRAAEDGTIEELLNHIYVKPGEVYFIPAGQVHAIGAGIVLAEVQESSNLTYRLYDYHRLDRNGKPRELHVEKALQVVDLRRQESAAAHLPLECEYFRVKKHSPRSVLELPNDDGSFHVLLCINGKGRLLSEEISVTFEKGSTIFVPAGCGNLRLERVPAEPSEGVSEGVSEGPSEALSDGAFEVLDISV